MQSTSPEKLLRAWPVPLVAAINLFSNRRSEFTKNNWYVPDAEPNAPRASRIPLLRPHPY